MLLTALFATCRQVDLGDVHPAARHAPKYFSMAARAASGVTLPMTTTVARSGRNTLR